MNEAFTELEEAIQERLARSSVDVPEIDAVRERVLQALENDSAPSMTQAPSTWAHNKRAVGMLIGVAAGIAAAAVFLPERSSQSIDVSTGDPSDAEVSIVDDGVRRFGFSDFQHLSANGLPLEELGDWAVREEAEHVVVLEFVPETAKPGDSSQYLRIVATHPATSPDEIVDSLTSSLFDTVVVSDTARQIGQLDSRVLRLETVGGTSSLGFKITDDTYLEAEGTNRVFVVYITTTESETLVFWIEASPEQIDGLEEVASRLVETLRSS